MKLKLLPKKNPQPGVYRNPKGGVTVVMFIPAKYKEVKCPW